MFSFTYATVAKARSKRHPGVHTQQPFIANHQLALKSVQTFKLDVVNVDGAVLFDFRDVCRAKGLHVPIHRNFQRVNRAINEEFLSLTGESLVLPEPGSFVMHVDWLPSILDDYKAWSTLLIASDSLSIVTGAGSDNEDNDELLLNFCGDVAGAPNVFESSPPLIVVRQRFEKFLEHAGRESQLQQDVADCTPMPPSRFVGHEDSIHLEYFQTLKKKLAPQKREQVESPDMISESQMMSAEPTMEDQLREWISKYENAAAQMEEILNQRPCLRQ